MKEAALYQKEALVSTQPRSLADACEVEISPSQSTDL